MRVSRRSFMAAAGAAAVSVGSASAFATAGSPQKIRMGVVGGNFGLQFFWHEHPDCVVTGVSDLRPERRDALARTYRCQQTYPSLDELIKAPDIDAVAVFTPAPDHVPHVTAALKAGKHVICAVPAAYSLDECHELLDAVKQTGLTYMSAETSYYRQETISARKFFKAGKFGRLFASETTYQHPGLDSLFVENGKRTWRYGFPPMHYPTHCTAFLVGVTGERLVSGSCVGWGDDSPILKDNVYKNPFWNASAVFRTSGGNVAKVNVWWNGAFRGTERATWFGDRMSFYCPEANGQGAVIVRSGGQTEKDDAGFVRQLPEFEEYKQPMWWQTDLLPEPLRHDSGHGGSHTFITHEFVGALLAGRQPTVNVHEALAYVAPGIVAHESALKGGQTLEVPSFD